MRCLLAGMLGLFSVGIGEATPITMKILVLGNDSGSNVFDRKADGTFTSVTELAAGPTKISAQLTGKYEGDNLVAFQLTQKTSGQPDLKMDFKDKVFMLTQGTVSEKRAFVGDPTLFVGNIHPQISQGALKKAMASKDPTAKVTTTLLEAAVALEMTFRKLAPKVIASGSVDQLETKFGPVEATFSVAQDGTVVAFDVPSQALRFLAVGYEALFVDPMAKYPELSQPTLAVSPLRVEKVRLRDGVDLATDVYLPTAPGKYPTIFTRTPYGRAAAGIESAFYVKRGYAYVVQDCRGRGDSGGAWDPFVNESRDGKDSIDWITAQPWSDGKVGMIGASYGGLVQWSAAVSKPAALKCIVPQVSPPDAFGNVPYDNGVFFLYGDLWWAKIVAEKNADMSGVQGALPHPDKFATLPLSKIDDAVLGRNIPFFDVWLAREKISDFAGFDYSALIGKVSIPVLMISGWFDGDEIGTQLNWQAQRLAKRPDRWLIYGPWTHAFNTTSKLAELDFGKDAILSLEPVYLKFFDTFLKGKSVGMADVPRVQAFEMGANRWRKLDDWPGTAATERTWHFTAEGPANGPASVGVLANRPMKEPATATYTYNPARAPIPKVYTDPKPSDATVVWKPEDRDDYLTFVSAPFDGAVTVGGPIVLDLEFSSTAVDTDFYAAPYLVLPSGEKRGFGQPGKIRASYREGFNGRKGLVPNKRYRVSFPLWDTLQEIPRGASLGVVIESSNFPNFARNLGTLDPIRKATRMVAQSNTLYLENCRLRAFVYPN